MKLRIKAVATIIILVSILSSICASTKDINPLNVELSESEASVAKAVTGRPSVALVLSGGGAKGLSYLPILEEIERRGIPIDKIFGTSIGSLVGGLYCAGYTPDEIKDAFKDEDIIGIFEDLSLSSFTEMGGAFDYNRNNVISYSPLKKIGLPAGFIDDGLVMKVFGKVLGSIPADIDFNRDLEIPFECNATDMMTGNEVIFSKGSLITALRSSMSLPFVFAPVKTEDGLVLMDGGIVDNALVHRARLEGFDIVICATISGYEDADLDASLYDTVVGAMDGYMYITNRVMSKTIAPEADYWVAIDVEEYSMIDFVKVDEIAGCGTRFLESYPEVIDSIASNFTEETKVYKDPSRTGAYFVKYPEAVPVQEKSVERNKFFMGAYGNGGLGFDLKNRDAHDRRVLLPTLSLRGILNGIIASPLSLDVKLKSTFGRSASLSSDILFCLNPDAEEKVQLFAGADASVGSLSSFTDIREAVSINEFEYSLSARAGMMMSNDRDNTLKVFASADFTWAYFNGKDLGYLFVPAANIDFVFCPGHESGLFQREGLRLDVLARLGYDRNSSSWIYKLGLSGEKPFRCSSDLSLWIDAKAFTSRESLALRGSYVEYGGWKGMPGYAYGTFCSDFINAGFGVKWNVSNGILSEYLAMVVRGGVRSSHIYGVPGESYGSQVPFADCFSSGLWDLGASVGYGFRSPIGDAVFGFGINKDLKLAVYFELV